MEEDRKNDFENVTGEDRKNVFENLMWEDRKNVFENLIWEAENLLCGVGRIVLGEGVLPSFPPAKYRGLTGLVISCSEP